MNAIRVLERRAIDAHARGDGWETFWQEHGAQVRAAEPYRRNAYHALVRRLLALVVSGDTDGQEPIDAEPWRTDDTDKPADVGTRARLLADAVPGLTTADRLEATR